MEINSETNVDGFKDNNQEQLVRAKKNIVYLLMFSVFMMFAGLSSAYIVSMGDSFWLKVPLPSGFWWSTGAILLSSVVMILATKKAKTKEWGAVKWLVLTTFVLGLFFIYFQLRGFGQLVDNGIHPAQNHIIVTDGRYGDYFEIKRGNDYIEVNGNDYLIGGKKLSEQEMKALQKFTAQFLNYSLKDQFKVTSYGAPYTLMFHNEPLLLEGTTLTTEKGEKLSILDRERLYFLALNIRDGRGDFFVRGTLGKDFHIYYKNEELTYKNRELYQGKRRVKGYMQMKAMEAADTASSYLYLMSVLHLVHVILTIIFLLGAVIRSFTGSIELNQAIRLRTTAIFWHFLGALWVYLLLFLLFIH